MDREQIYEEETIREQARLDEKNRREAPAKLKAKAKEKRNKKIAILRNTISFLLLGFLAYKVYIAFWH